jgi:hypothetical protein
LAAAQFGNNNATRKPLAEHSSAFARLGAPQQAELFCDAQASVLAQVRLEGTAIGEAKAANTNYPIRETTLGQVCASAWIPPQRIAVQGASRVQDELLFERQSIPPPQAFADT